MRCMHATALLVLAFGGPEGPEDALSFVRAVTRGRAVPEARLREVAARYKALGGSPLPAQARALAESLATAWRQRLGRALSIATGFLHGEPSVEAALRDLAAEGHEALLVLPMSAFGGAAACRKYREALAVALERLGERAPRSIVVAPPFFGLPGLLRAHARALLEQLAELPDAFVLFTAHSVPERMPGADRYRAQLEACCREVARLAGVPPERWTLTWQSRSGDPRTPWFGPSPEAVLEDLRQAGETRVVLGPIGFLSDHMEVVWDLDREVVPHGARLGLRVGRAATPGTDPAFVANLVRMLRALEEGRCPDFGRLQHGPWGMRPCDWSLAHRSCCTPQTAP